MKKFFIKPNSSIKKALSQLNQSGEKCLIVVRDKNKLLGTINDGDIRRAILKGKPLNDTIRNIYGSNPIL